MPYPSVFRPIRRGNYRVSPFQVFKEWVVEEHNYSASGYTLQCATHMKEITPIGKTTLSTFGNNHLPAGTVLDITTRAGNDNKNNFDGSFQNVIWHSINHKYYKFPYDPVNNLGASNPNRIEKFLFLSASSLTIPYFKVGEKIKPGTVKVHDNTNGFVLNDDGKGNLRDHLIDSSSFADKKTLVGYWGFNTEFKRFKVNHGTHSYPIDFESSVYEPDVKSIAHEVQFSAGIPTTGTAVATSSGMMAEFSVGDNNSYIKTDAIKPFNFITEDDYAISFWYGGNVSQSKVTKTTNTLITKRGVQDTLRLSKKTRKRYIKEENKTMTRFPFDLSVYNETAGTSLNGKILFRRSDGVKTFSSASATACTSGHHHILAQKSGSYLELWIDGTREFQANDPVTLEVRNYSKLMFGALNTLGDQGLSGSLDEIRIYNKALTETAISSLANNHYLSSSAYQTSTAGNVHYRNGQIVVSSCLPKYWNALGAGGNATGDWKVEYKGTHTIWENEVLCEVPAGHCNVTMNPSALIKADSDRLKKDFTGSLRPYITTVGLYNEDAQLLAIGKLAQPIQKRDDVDMNFIVRWDY